MVHSRFTLVRAAYDGEPRVGPSWRIYDPLRHVVLWIHEYQTVLIMDQFEQDRRATL